tara:strand:- start:859 stop:1056 length:198 start_codon:yes stop_codon:yes gene_type:complete
MRQQEHDPSLRYRVIAVTREVLQEGLSFEDAQYYIDNMIDQGVTNLEMEEYFPDSNRLGRDPDLH